MTDQPTCGHKWLSGITGRRNRCAKPLGHTDEHETQDESASQTLGETSQCLWMWETSTTKANSTYICTEPEGHRGAHVSEGGARHKVGSGRRRTANRCQVWTEGQYRCDLAEGHTGEHYYPDRPPAEEVPCPFSIDAQYRCQLTKDHTGDHRFNPPPQDPEPCTVVLRGVERCQLNRGHNQAHRYRCISFATHQAAKDHDPKDQCELDHGHPGDHTFPRAHRCAARWTGSGVLHYCALPSGHKGQHADQDGKWLGIPVSTSPPRHANRDRWAPGLEVACAVLVSRMARATPGDREALSEALAELEAML